MFVKIDNILINLNNVVGFAIFDTGLIRIFLTTNGEYIDITKENKEDLNKTWEELENICLRQVGKQK